MCCAGPGQRCQHDSRKCTVHSNISPSNGFVNRTLNSLRYQYYALRIASSALDLHLLAIQEAFETVTSNAERDLEKQHALLTGLDADLEIVQRVPIHKEFLSPSTRRAIELGERSRTLGDYVSAVKMRQVAMNRVCQRVSGWDAKMSGGFGRV